jgi:glutamyl-tRNA synthetase
MLTYRGRLAPSPTGYLHLGHARTFWVAWRRARAAGGALVFRNEDLDQQRCRPQYVQAMYEDLGWLGLTWDEGPEIGGPFSPYSQSQRRDFYLDAWRRLRDRGFIYPCSCSRKDLERALEAPHDDSDEAPYPGTCRHKLAVARDFASPADVSWRFRVPDPPRHAKTERAGGPGDPPRHAKTGRAGGPGDPPRHAKTGRAGGPGDPPRHAKTGRAGGPGDPPRHAKTGRAGGPGDGEAVNFEDGYFGEQSFLSGKDFSDFLIWRRDDIPAYQLAVVVDDAAMQITEVVRGADLVKSAARQILLFRALGDQPPRYFHCPLLRDEHNVRLAKRHDALSLRTLREQGADPAALRERFAREIEWNRNIS